MADRQRLIIDITGAARPIFGIRALEVLQDVPNVETHLIFSPAAAQTIAAETNLSLDDVRSYADVVHSFKDIAASISSGSFQTLGMMVAPCSIKTLSQIVNCLTDNLIARATDVCLKERRKVLLMVRETPLHLGHLDLMTRATQYGAIMMPPMPAFYHRPQSVDDIVDQTVGRALDQFGIDTEIVHRWRETQTATVGNQ